MFKFNLTEPADDAGIPPLQANKKLNVPVLLVVAEYVTDVAYALLKNNAYNFPITSKPLHLP